MTKDMMLGEVIEKHPESAEVMMKHGMHCVGCHVSAFETIEQGCRGHGMSDEDIDDMVKEINLLIEKKKE